MAGRREGKAHVTDEPSSSKPKGRTARDERLARRLQEIEDANLAREIAGEGPVTRSQTLTIGERVQPHRQARATTTAAQGAPTAPQRQVRSKKSQLGEKPVTHPRYPVPYGVKFYNKDDFRKYKDFVDLGKEFISSRFVDIPTLETLGLLDTVRDMLSQLSLWDFLTREVFSYHSLTLEFYCTAKFHFTDPPEIQFRIRGVPHRITAELLSVILGCPWTEVNQSCENTFGEWYPYGSFINDITGKLYNPNHKKTSLIQHPAIRYVQRILSYSVLPRGEAAATLVSREMFWVYCMLFRNTDGTAVDTPNLPISVIKHLAEQVKSSGRKSYIPIGGLVTRFFMHFYPREPLDPNDIIEGPTTIDIRGMMNFGMLAKKRQAEIRPPYHYILPSGNLVRLPLEYPLDFEDTNTWLLEPPEIPGYDEEEEEPVWGEEQVPPEQHYEPAAPPPQYAGDTSLSDIMAQLTLFREYTVDQFGGIRGTLGYIEDRVDDVERQQRIDSRNISDIHGYGRSMGWFDGNNNNGGDGGNGTGGGDATGPSYMHE